MEWVKVFANHISEKGLIFRIYKESYNSTTKQTSPLENGQRTLIDISPKKVYCTNGLQAHEKMLNEHQ